MQKLTLKLEQLCVETFVTEMNQTKTGTVVGAQGSAYPEYSCPATCNEGCSDDCEPWTVVTNGLRTCIRCPDEY